MKCPYSQASFLDLVREFRGDAAAACYSSYKLGDWADIEQTAKEVLEKTQPRSGWCAPMSAIWAAMLQDHYQIPAVVVAGDLLLEQQRIFKCDRNIEITSNRAPGEPASKWDGHCWVELDGYVGDISLFRTAYSAPPDSRLRSFVELHFGLGRGMIFANRKDLVEQQMYYQPKYVLTDAQINGLCNGLVHEM